jgi:hypothetical protein
MGLKAAGTKRKIRIAKLEAYRNAKLYMRIKIKQFKPGEMVLLFNSRVHLFGHGKLRSSWRSLLLPGDAHLVSELSW